MFLTQHRIDIRPSANVNWLFEQKVLYPSHVQYVEGIRNTDTENAVHVHEDHVDESLHVSPPIGLVEVLQEEVGCKGRPNEEEAVHCIEPCKDGPES